MKNYTRDEDRGEKVREQAESERDGEAFDRASPEDKQKKCRNDGSDVGINNGDEGFAEALVHGCGSGLAVAQLFADALKDEYVGIYTHTDSKNDTGDARKSQCGAGEAEKTEQDRSEERRVGKECRSR